MESNRRRHDADDERVALAGADEALRRLTSNLRLPAGLYLGLATAVAMQIGTATFGVAAQTVDGLVVALAGLAAFLGMAALMLHRFRLVNGIRLDGFTSQIVLAAGASASVVYLGAFAAAVWAAFASLWWLVALAAVVGGTGCALGARHWWAAYRHDPSAHARGVSPRLLGALAVLACLGFAGLVVIG